MHAIGIAVLSALALPAIAEQPDWNAATAALDKTVAEEAAKLNGPSFSVAVVSLRHPAHFVSQGYAEVERKIPATPQTVYEIGSISKIFTGTMLMQMRDRGLASLDDPLQKHIPEFKLPSPFTGETHPTLRQLVTHTSGLPRTTPRFSEMEGERGNAEQALASLAQTEAAFPPFTVFKYSNIDIGLAGYGLARTAQTTWRNYIEREIAKPLGMTQTGGSRDSARSKIAQGYVPSGNGPKPVVPMYFPPLAEAAGAMVSSTSDLAIFAKWHLDDADSRALKAESRREMRAPLWMDEGWQSGTGVAWALMRHGDEVLACHGGGTNGFNAMLCIDANLGIGIVVLGNSMADSQTLALRLLDPLITAAKSEKTVANAATPPLPKGIEHFVGTYAHDIGMVPPVTVSVENGKLMMRDDNWGAVVLVPGRRANEFIVKDNRPLFGETVTFVDEGATALLLVGHGSIVYQRTP